MQGREEIGSTPGKRRRDQLENCFQTWVIVQTVVIITVIENTEGEAD